MRTRGALSVVALGIVTGCAALALYGVVAKVDTGGPDAPTAAPAPAVPARAPVAASDSTTAPPTLKITVTGARCQLFVRKPDGDILLDRTLERGGTISFNDRELNAVVYDGGAAIVEVNGERRPAGTPGKRMDVTAVRK